MAKNNELIRLAKKAADAWRNTDGYQQAAQIIDMLVEELESDAITQPNEPELAGLYGKYTVLKNEDGSLVTNCFVLRPEKDPAAVATLRAYAATTDNVELADDIINWVGAEPNEPLTLEELSLLNAPVWIKRIGDEDLSGEGWAIVEGPRCLTWHNRIPVSWEIRVRWPGSEEEDYPKYENYGKTWLAYRRPPEGEEET